nr:DDE-type integrase/transposase/recombinase [Microbacterium sp. ZXX196]
MSERTAWRICRDNQWWSVFGKKRGTNGKHPGPPVHDDPVQRDLTADDVNELWLTDITEHWTDEGKLYLCAIKDVFSGRIVGYSISDRMKARLAVNALDNAISRRRDAADCIVHSDRGSQGVFNRSSQHLDSGGERWRRKTGLRRPAMRPRGFVGSGARIGLSGRRCVRPDGLRPRRRCSDSSGG